MDPAIRLHIVDEMSGIAMGFAQHNNYAHRLQDHPASQRTW